MTAEEFKGKRNMIPVQNRVNSIDYMVTHNLFTEKEMISFAEAYHQEKMKQHDALVKMMAQDEKEGNYEDVLGVAKFIKSPKGRSCIKNLTIGKEYQIINRFSRSELRKSRPNLCDGFEIIKDNNQSGIYFNENFFEVTWNKKY